MHWVLTSSDDARSPDCGYHQSPKLESHRLQSGSAGGTALSCLFFVNGGFDLRGQLGGELLHSMRGASMLDALFQHFLLGLTSGDKVTIHPNISACNHFSHTISSNSLPRVNPRETISKSMTWLPTALPQAGYVPGRTLKFYYRHSGGGAILQSEHNASKNPSSDYLAELPPARRAGRSCCSDRALRDQPTSNYSDSQSEIRRLRSRRRTAPADRAEIGGAGYHFRRGRVREEGGAYRRSRGGSELCCSAPQRDPASLGDPRGSASAAGDGAIARRQGQGRREGHIPSEATRRQGRRGAQVGAGRKPAPFGGDAGSRPRGTGCSEARAHSCRRRSPQRDPGIARSA